MLRDCGRPENMAPIDWDRLMKLDLQELQDDAASAEDMYCVLCQVQYVHSVLIMQWTNAAIILAYAAQHLNVFFVDVCIGFLVSV